MLSRCLLKSSNNYFQDNCNNQEKKYGSDNHINHSFTIQEGETIMESVKDQSYTGERALFKARNLKVYDSIFHDGESPLKESNNVEIYNSMFKWKYPIWYANNIKVEDSFWFENARAGVWYTNHITVNRSIIEAPKNFRRCNFLTLDQVNFTDAAETLWHCNNVVMNDVSAKGDYFAMNSTNMKIDHLKLVGNYPFDGARNIEIHNSKLMSKDAFWNADHVVVYDSFISGEYLGWNAKNITFINCTIESLQGLCYIDNLKMINCKLINTTLAFEYSTVEADIVGKIDSVLNPTSGKIIADSIDELIIEKDEVDPTKTMIICRNKKEA